MNTPPKTDYLLVVAGIWVMLGGLHFWLGVFLPKYRARHGRRSNPGPEMTAPEQALWAASFLGGGAFAILYAFHWLPIAAP